MINKISFENYKLFKNWQTLEIKPITILIGKNSSGKSAVAKLPALISGSLSGTFPQPFKMEYKGIKFGVSNRDLVYNRNPATSLLSFKIENTKSEELLEVTIYATEKPEFFNWSYKKASRIEKISTFKKDKFKGFRNTNIEFHDLNLNFDYIEAFRARPERGYIYDEVESSTVGVDGANAYNILIQSFERRDGLAQKVSDWYKENFEGWELSVKKKDSQDYQIALSTDMINDINIVNVGHGIHQVLPLIVRSYMEEEEEVLIIIEEPETHLHPAAHGNLAKRFVDSYLEDSKKHYLIETHSQNFCLRMRRMVAEKKLKKEDLVFYYVDYDKKEGASSLTKIEVDDCGGVSSWPSGFFSETLNDTIAIRNAQLNYLQI